MFTVLLVYLPVLLGRHLVFAGQKPHDLWSIKKPGDVVLSGMFPLRNSLSTRNFNNHFGFNFEGITWMASMIRRISELNRAGVLPGNITVGYNIRDSSNDPKYSKRQTLSILNNIFNRDASDQAFYVPVVIGPASYRVQLGSENLYKMFNVPRIFYTTTSSTIDNGTIIRTVPSDLVHIEALVLLLKDMDCKEVTIIASRTDIWQKRVNAFQINMKKREMSAKNVIYIDSKSLRLPHVGSRVVVVFAEANIARIVIKGQKKQGLTWIVVSRFDDPLLSVFDSFGKLTSKTIIRNLKQAETRDYKGYFPSGTFEKSNGKSNKTTESWFREVQGKYMQQCFSALGKQNEESRRKKCSKKRFRKTIEPYFGGRNGFRSTLTLKGVENSVDLIVSSLKKIMRNCLKRNEKDLRSCLRQFPKANWFDSLKKANLRDRDEVFDLNKQYTLTGRYSIQILRKNRILPGKTFEKIREWNITEDLRDVRVGNTLPSNGKTTPKTKDSEMDPSTRAQSDDSCSRCDDTLPISKCNSGVTVIAWNHRLAIALYSLEILTFLAVVLSFLYFLRHRHSPIMILCYSWPDNVVLAVLGIFCVLPMMHIGELSSQRCSALWPVVNVIFAFYAALLLTKTLFVQNLLKCEVATERPGRRFAFSVLIVIILLVVFTTFPIFGFPNVLRFSCPSRGVIVICDIRGNIGVIGSMVFNWLLLFVLCVLAALETARERKNFCRTENLLGVAAAGLVSYTCLVIAAYLNLQLKHYLAVTFIRCIVYLINPSICLAFIYLPTLRLVSTWLRQHIRQKRNLTSIKRAQVMSSKRHSAGPLNSIFGTGFSTTEQSLLPLERPGYYFDCRPASAFTDMSYPNSLVPNAYQPTRVDFGHRLTNGIISPHNCLSFQSMDELESLNPTVSCNSVYDNMSTGAPAEENCNQSTCSPEEVMREISTYWGRPENSDVYCDKNQNEDVALAVEETNEWPSPEGLPESDI